MMLNPLPGVRCSTYNSGFVCSCNAVNLHNCAGLCIHKQHLHVPAFARVDVAFAVAVVVVISAAVVLAVAAVVVNIAIVIDAVAAVVIVVLIALAVIVAVVAIFVWAEIMTMIVTQNFIKNSIS